MHETKNRQGFIIKYQFYQSAGKLKKEGKRLLLRTVFFCFITQKWGAGLMPAPRKV